MVMSPIDGNDESDGSCAAGAAYFDVFCVQSGRFCTGINLGDELADAELR